MSKGPNAACAEQFETVQTLGVRWRVRADWSERLLSDGAPDWTTLQTDPRAECIKRGDGRTMWRVTLRNKQSVFLKEFDFSASAADRVKAALGFSAAEREARSAIEAHIRGVPTTQCVAMGTEECAPRRRFLVTEHIDDTVALSEGWKSATNAGPIDRAFIPRRLLLSAVAELFAAAHENGFRHADAHPDNILVKRELDGSIAAYFVDLPDARINWEMWGPYSVSIGAGDLAQIDQWAKRHATRTERLQLLRYYLRRRIHVAPRYVGRKGEKTYAREVVSAGIVHAARLARTRDRRLRRNGKYFARLKLGDGWRGRFALELERREVFPEPDVPDRPVKEWKTLLEKCFSPPNQDPVTDCIQVHRFAARGMLQKLLWVLMGSPPRRMFVHAHRLRHRNLPAPLALGFAEHRNRAGIIDQAALILPRSARLKSD